MTFVDAAVAHESTEESVNGPSTAPIQDLNQIVEDIVVAHENLLEATRNVVQRALELGALLLEAKEKVGHGPWMAWVEENFTARTGLSHRSANIYMKLKRYADEYPDELEQLVSGSMKDALAYIDGRTQGLDSQTAANIDLDEEDDGDDGDEEQGELAEQTASDGAATENKKPAKARKSGKLTSAERGRARAARMRSKDDAIVGWWNALQTLAGMIQADEAPSLEGWKSAPKLSELIDAAGVIVEYLTDKRSKLLNGGTH